MLDIDDCESCRGPVDAAPTRDRSQVVKESELR